MIGLLAEQGLLRNASADVLRQHFVDQRLISNAPPPRLLAKLVEHSWINANRNEMTGFVAQSWTANAAHAPQLLRR